MALPIGVIAARTAAKIVNTSKLFVSGIGKAASSTGKNLSGSIGRLENATKKRRIASIRKKRNERITTERIQQLEKQGRIKVRGGKIGGVNNIKKAIEAPFKALMFLLGAWLVDNLPEIWKRVKIFVKKVRVTVALIKRAFTNVYKIFGDVGNIISAVIKNIQEFDFSDKSKRIQNAQRQFDDRINELGSSFSNIQKTWSLEEDKLDRLLKDLESEKTVNEVFDNIDSDIPTAQPQTPLVGPGSSGGGSKGRWGPLLDLIAKAESVNGSYDSAYPSKIIPGLSQMTIGEAISASGGTDSTGKHYAIGRYQFTKLGDQAKRAGLTLDDQFSPANQDAMAIALIEQKRGVTPELLETNPTLAAKELAQEWAGLPVLESTQGAKRQVSRGESFYEGDGVNAAKIVSPDDITNTFDQVLSNKSNTGSGAMSGVETGSGSLTDTVAYSDFSRTRAEGGRGLVGKTDDYLARGGTHKGVDIGTSQAKDYYVALKLNGTVKSNTSGPNAGWYVSIMSGGKEYYFMHLARQSPLKVGSKYNAGDIIGNIGNTGRSTSEHLHYEVRINGRNVDPNPYLNLLIIGKLARKSNTSRISNNSQNNANNLSEKASSMRTGEGSVRNNTIIAVKRIFAVPTG